MRAKSLMSALSSVLLVACAVAARPKSGYDPASESTRDELPRGTLVAQAGPSAPLDTVHLTDGGLLRGVITDDRPGQSLSLRLVSGRTRTFNYSEISKVERASAAAPKPAAPASGGYPGAGPPGLSPPPSAGYPATQPGGYPAAPAAGYPAPAPAPAYAAPAAAPPPAPAPAPRAPVEPEAAPLVIAQPAPAPAPAPASAKGAPPEPGPLSQKLQADPDADPEVLLALDKAHRADAAGKTATAEAVAAWKALGKLKGANPYAAEANARAGEWEPLVAFASQKVNASKGARDKLARALKLDGLSLEMKKQLLEKHVAQHGAESGALALDEVPAGAQRSALCLLLPGASVEVQARAGSTVSLDGVEVGPPGPIKIPPCAKKLKVVDPEGNAWEQPLASPLPAVFKARQNELEVREKIVVDLKHAIAWQRKASPGPLDYADANAYCAALPKDGGKAWRLPTKPELLALVKPKGKPATIDFQLFPQAEPVAFWTATEEERLVRWTVDFRFGTTLAKSERERFLVRCARDN